MRIITDGKIVADGNLRVDRLDSGVIMLSDGVGSNHVVLTADDDLSVLAPDAIEAIIAAAFNTRRNGESEIIEDRILPMVHAAYAKISAALPKLGDPE